VLGLDDDDLIAFAPRREGSLAQALGAASGERFEEVRRKLGELGLTLGMKIEGAPREAPKKEET